MYCQEYDNDCPSPNGGKTFISYLDSAKFFTPSKLRTQVYGEVISQYLHHMKAIGYSSAHLWACTPEVGMEYVFHRRPDNQVPSTEDRLIVWYEAILDEARNKGVIMSYHKSVGLRTCPYKTPYFNGDVWPGLYEHLLEKYNFSQMKKKLEERSEVSVVLSEHVLFTNLCVTHSLFSPIKKLF